MMSNWKIDRNALRVRLWGWFVVGVLVLGLVFRVMQLEEKVYWVDEVATSIRVAGYTKQQVITQVATGELFTPQALQHYQQLTPERSFADTLHALSLSPEHAPLYFVLARLWLQGVGDSVASIRSLSVCFSLLALPCLYWLSWELFQSQLVSTLAVSLFWLSPFFIAYAQEARPYSLWSVTLMLSAAALLRALRKNSSSSWGMYSLSVMVSLYTSLLSLLVLLGQGVYVLLLGCGTRRVRNYGIALTCGLLAFLPWLGVVLWQWSALESNTTWMRLPMHPLAMAAVWLYSYVILFLDLPVSTALTLATLAKFLVALAIVALMLASIYFLCTRAPKPVWLFVLTLLLSTPLILILLDSILHGQASATPRYLIPSQLGILLAIVYLLGSQLKPTAGRDRKPLWVGVTALLILISLVSDLSNLQRLSAYQKARNQSNLAIAAVLNQANQPILLAESNETMDILSLSHSLKPQVKIAIASPAQLLTKLDPIQDIFLFNPSNSLRHQIDRKKQVQVKQVYQPELLTPDDIYLSLWQVKRIENYRSHS